MFWQEILIHACCSYRIFAFLVFPENGILSSLSCREMRFDTRTIVGFHPETVFFRPGGVNLGAYLSGQKNPRFRIANQ
jgi:hypothetical protein